MFNLIMIVVVLGVIGGIGVAIHHAGAVSERHVWEKRLVDTCGSSATTVDDCVKAGENKIKAQNDRDNETRQLALAKEADQQIKDAIEAKRKHDAETGALRSALADARQQLKAKVHNDVTPLADSRCVIPAGFVRHRNARIDATQAGTETEPAAGGDVNADSGLTLSALADRLDDDYGQCKAVVGELTAEVTSWREFYVRENARFSSPLSAGGTP